MNRYKKLSKDQINEMPLIKYEGEIHVLSYKDSIQKAVDYLSTQKVIGFDTETRPSFTKNKSYKVSLLQLSTPNKVFLFRLKTLGLPKPLAQLLNDPTHFKIGLALNQDIKGLQELAPFKARSFIDLQTLAKNSEIEIGHNKLKGQLPCKNQYRR